MSYENPVQIRERDIRIAKDGSTSITVIGEGGKSYQIKEFHYNGWPEIGGWYALIQQGEKHIALPVHGPTSTPSDHGDMG